MNELLYAKVPARQVKTVWLLDKSKGAQTAVWNRYNQMKKEWTAKVQKLSVNLTPVESAFFSYVVCETSRRRDPSNIASSAIKFIEDGLQKAGIIPNDGWDQVLGINTYWLHIKENQPGVKVIMSSNRLTEEEVFGNTTI